MYYILNITYTHYTLLTIWDIQYTINYVLYVVILYTVCVCKFLIWESPIYLSKGSLELDTFCLAQPRLESRLSSSEPKPQEGYIFLQLRTAYDILDTIPCVYIYIYIYIYIIYCILYSTYCNQYTIYYIPYIAYYILYMI